MTVGANSYGTVAGIERLIGDIVSSRTFSASTVPTTTQVEAEIDNVAAEINSTLESYDYTAPVASTDTFAYAYLTAANNYGAAARLLGTIPSVAWLPDGEGEVGNTRAQMYEKYLKDALKRIEEHKLKASMATRRLARMIAGAAEDDDGNTKYPLFRRRMHEYPGSRTMITDESDYSSETRQ